MMIKAFAFAALVAGAVAECPNGCSGNGDCQNKDQCQCYDGFFGGDCSLRMCPQASAFVDTPRGDLNHDGVVGRGTNKKISYSKVQWSRYLQYETWPTLAGTFPTTALEFLDPTDGNIVGGWKAQVGEAHFMTECAGKGICDRELGVCKCFDGYTGGACQRTTCPNDCSGNGLCRTVREVAVRAYNKKFIESVGGENYYAGITSPYEYRLWDADQNSMCVCDVGYTGFDCSLRECPKGDDPLTTSVSTCGGSACTDEVQSFSVDGDQTSGTYYLRVLDYYNNTYQTADFVLVTKHTTPAEKAANFAANELAIKTAIESLPNNVVSSVKVSSTQDGATSAASSQYRASVTFTGVSGNFPEMSLGYVGGGNSYLFQPGQPVQSVAFPTAFNQLSARVSVYPKDSSLYGRSEYWTACVNPAAAIADEDDVTDALIASLNAIPAIRLDLGNNAFVKAVNVLQLTSDVLFAFRDKQFGGSTIAATLYANANCAGAETTLTVNNFNDVIDGNKEHVTCSNRGLCDYDTGLCSCFNGYTGVACGIQSTLAV